MTINQLFRKLPEKDFVIMLFNTFGIKDLEKPPLFTRADIDNSNLLEIINENNNIFEEIYIPCKYNVYFKNLNSKKVVTVLRQLLKTINFTIESFEKCINGQKRIMYQIRPFEPKVKKDKKDMGLITFD